MVSDHLMRLVSASFQTKSLSYPRTSAWQGLSTWQGLLHMAQSGAEFLSFGIVIFLGKCTQLPTDGYRDLSCRDVVREESCSRRPCALVGRVQPLVSCKIDLDP